MVVDDGSVNRTAEFAREAGAVVIQHAVNQGVGKSFQDGLICSLENAYTSWKMSVWTFNIIKLILSNLFTPTSMTIIDGKADFVTADRFNDEKGRIPQPALLISSEVLEKTPKEKF